MVLKPGNTFDFFGEFAIVAIMASEVRSDFNYASKRQQLSVRSFPMFDSFYDFGTQLFFILVHAAAEKNDKVSLSIVPAK